MNPAIATAPEMSTGRTLRVFRKEASYEFLKLLRLPMYTVGTILFPVMFYILFGIGMRGKGADAHMTSYLLASYGCFGVMGASLFGFGASVAVERGQGWVQLKKVSPMPPLAYFTAKLFMAMMFSSIVVTLLIVLGISFGGVALGPLDIAKLLGILVAGTIPFGAMGLAIGYFAGPNSAAAVVNLIYLPMSFCSGLWVPVNFLPKLLKPLIPFLPPYHLGQLALSVVHADRGEPAVQHVIALVVTTALFLLLARIGYLRDEGKMYG